MRFGVYFLWFLLRGCFVYCSLDCAFTGLLFGGLWYLVGCHFRVCRFSLLCLFAVADFGLV